MSIIQWNKKYTETLAKTLERFRLECPEHNDEKVTYAGRLDPMAEGLLLLLTGEDVHQKDDFLGLDKVYEVDLFFGPDTDTHDLLGLIQKNNPQPIARVESSQLKDIFAKFTGSFDQEYPPFSSKPVNGKPLFMWAREGRLDEIVFPTKKISIYGIELIGKNEIPFGDFVKNICLDVSSVEGDFRQEEIVNKWKEYFINNEEESVVTYKIRVKASSGVYMRKLVSEIGKGLGVSATTVKIKRISVGEYTL